MINHLVVTRAENGVNVTSVEPRRTCYTVISDPNLAEIQKRRVEKLSVSRDSTALRTTSSSKHGKVSLFCVTLSASHIFVEEFWPSVHLVKLRRHWSRFCLGHCDPLILFFFNHSLVDLLMWLDSLSRCMTQYQPSFGCQTDGLQIWLQNTLVYRGVGRVWDIALGFFAILTLRWTCSDVHSWNDCQMSWTFTSCKSSFLTVEQWTPACLEMVL